MFHASWGNNEVSFLMTAKMGDHSLMSGVNADGFVLRQGWLTVAKEVLCSSAARKQEKGTLFMVPEFRVPSGRASLGLCVRKMPCVVCFSEVCE